MSENNNNMPENNEVKPRGFSNKRNIIIIALAAALALGGGIAAVAIGSGNSSTQSEAAGMQLAERYLSELKYKQAIIEFQRVLEIEPMNVYAYLGLAKAYVGLGDTEKALETLRKGLELTGDPRIQAMIDELTKPIKPPVSSSAASTAVSSSSSSSSAVSSSKPAMSSSSSSSSSVRPVQSSSSAPTESKPMGSVTILGTELDIASTKKLLVINADLYGAGSWKSSSITKSLEDPENKQYFDGVIRLNSALTSADIGEIAKLSQLNRLEIYYSDLPDLTPLAGSTKLSTLTFEFNNITDEKLKQLAPQIGKIANLKNLTIAQNQISNIEPLSGLTNLTSLNLERNQIDDLTSISGLTGLKNLILDFNQISDITPLSGLTSLTQLNLQFNQIGDITPIGGLTNLTRLILSNNQIGDIAPLYGLANLTNLSLGSNQIGDSDKSRLETQLPNCKITF